MASLGRVAYRTDAGSGFSAFRSAQPKTGVVGTLPRGSIAVDPIGFGGRQIARIRVFDNRLRLRRLKDHRRKDLFGLLTVVGRRASDGDAQRHRMFVGRPMNGRAALGAIYGRRSVGGPPLDALYLEPSRRILSQLVPRGRSYFLASCRHVVRRQWSCNHLFSRTLMVFPQGKHGGTIWHPTPLISTSLRPRNTVRLSQGGRPWPHQITGGRTGSKVLHTSSRSRRERSQSLMAQASTPDSHRRHVFNHAHEDLFRLLKVARRRSVQGWIRYCSIEGVEYPPPPPGPGRRAGFSPQSDLVFTY